ncbi:flagellar hook-associated protein FlgL [Paenibacillus sp. TRM 82003]|nr:flagellar hook-associated protein FlgL [Paenibacillus sp. TRM 82003]MCI3923390.1 flagellar hook-associated protein FlgL [Paenibacillus sp. TRM 82003]
MPARVTQNMLGAQMLRNLNNNLRRMDEQQNQLSTGRRINKPSDDPVGISFSMRYRSELSVNDQYEKNIDSANSWLDYTDTMLDQAGSVFHRFRELVVAAANGTNDETALASYKSETEQLYQQMVQIGNSQFNGKYVFNGQRTDVPPYDPAIAETQVTDTVNVHFEISVGVKMSVSSTGTEIFGQPNAANPDGDNAFQLFKDFSAALTSGDSGAMTAMLDRIDSRMEKFLEVRSDVGARSNRMELAENRIADIGVNLQSLRSKTEDADMAEVITNLKMSENVYQASLSAGARLIRPTLLDFLR